MDASTPTQTATYAYDRPELQRDQMRMQQQGIPGLDAPVTYRPFKFESRRLRIDWRLLHGVDINKLIRDTDLDTLERLVSCITWGDIEAEDTRHLSEGNFVKVFRLAQLLVEYLLYVQDNLKYTNSVLEQSRSKSLLHMQTLNSRCREYHTQLKQCKKELRRARKTVRTLEIMATAVGTDAAAPSTAAAPAPNAPVVQQSMPAEQQQQHQQQQHQQGVTGMPSGSQLVALPQSHGVVTMTAGELLLQNQISDLTERLAIAGCEVQRLREDREELQYQVRQLHELIAAKADGLRSLQQQPSPCRQAANTADAAATAAAKQLQQQLQQQLDDQQEQQQHLMMDMAKLEAQLQQLQVENKGLRQQLAEKGKVDFSATNEVTAALQKQLNEKTEEFLQAQDKLLQSERARVVFEKANETLKEQINALQRQLNSPEAAMPSFFAKQRKSIAMAEATAGKAQAQIEQLKVENVELAKQVAALQAQVAGSGQPPMQQQQHAANKVTAGAAADVAETDMIAAAEQLLAGKDCIQQQQQSDWKLAEIERLQEENRLLQQKVLSLQEQLHELERINTQLERQVIKARNLGLTASVDSSARSPSPLESGPVGAAGSSNMLSGWANSSVHSSGPRVELTAADLAAGMGAYSVTSAAASPGTDDEHLTEQAIAGAQQLIHPGQQLNHSSFTPEAESVAITVKPVAGGLVKGMMQKFGGEGVGSDDVADSSQSTAIPAYRPEQDALSQPTAQEQRQQLVGLAGAVKSTLLAAQQTGSGGANVPASARSAADYGSINNEAAQQLKAIAAQVAAMPAEQLATEYAEACDDWDKPFDLNPDEKEEFRSLLPMQMPGRPGLLIAVPHDQQELVANQGRLLAEINKQLDLQLASYGIHPGRTRLSTTEFVAAVKMLHERRGAWASQLSPEVQDQVEVTRLGLMLHAYSTLQGVLQQQPAGSDGKQHLPGPVTPALTSEVQLLSSLPAPAATGPKATAGVVAPIQQRSSQLGSSHFQQAGLILDSGSPQRQGNYNPACSDAAIAGPLHAAASHVTSRAASYTTATVYAASRTLGRSSPELTQEVITKAMSSGVFSPMSAALHAKQQLNNLSPRSTSASAAAVDPSESGRISLGSVTNETSMQQQDRSSSPAPNSATSRLGPTTAAQLTAKAASSSPYIHMAGKKQLNGVAGDAAAVAMKDFLDSSFNNDDAVAVIGVSRHDA